MNDLNLCQFIGRLGQDPDVKYMPNGKAVANISIACSKSWKDQNGQQQEKTTWVNVTAYERLAEIIGEYLKKGSQVYMSGALNVRKWQDQSGNDRYTTEIIANQMQMLSSKQQGQGQQGGPKPQSSTSMQNMQEPQFDEDGCPF